jgi:hypothetical protein
VRRQQNPHIPLAPFYRKRTCCLFLVGWTSKVPPGMLLLSSGFKNLAKWIIFSIIVLKVLVYNFISISRSTHIPLLGPILVFITSKIGF